ncbi:hypothetical protein I4U23_016689 [Adineta vaga]|nr:hypothetical protein I4U23_016689 [Adineta vaga]
MKSFTSNFNTLPSFLLSANRNAAGELTRNETIGNFLPNHVANVYLNYEYINKINAFGLFVASLPVCSHLLGNDVYLNYLGNRLNPVSLNVIVGGATGTLKSTVIRQAIEPFERISNLVPRLQMSVEKVKAIKPNLNTTDTQKEKQLFTHSIVLKSTIIDNTTPVGLLMSFNTSENLLIATTEADTQLGKFGLFDTTGSDRHTESSDTLIKAYDGQISNFSRMTGAGGSIYVEHGVLSFIGGSTLEKFFNVLKLILEYRSSTGLYTRFLYLTMPQIKSIRVDAYKSFQINQRLPSLSFLYLIISQMEQVEFHFRKTQNSQPDSHGIDRDDGDYDANSALNFYVNHVGDINDNSLINNRPQYEHDIIVKMMEHAPRLCCIIQSILIALSVASSFEDDLSFDYGENTPIDSTWLAIISERLNSMYFSKTPISNKNKFHIVYVELTACEIAMKLVDYFLKQALTLFNTDPEHIRRITASIASSSTDMLLNKKWLRRGYPAGGSITGQNPVSKSLLKDNSVFDKQLDELVQAGLLHTSVKMIEAGEKQSNYSRNYFKCYYRCLPGLSNEEQQDFQQKLNSFEINTTLENYIRFHNECIKHDLPKQYVIGKEQMLWYQERPQYRSEFQHYFPRETFVLKLNDHEQINMDNAFQTFDNYEQNININRNASHSKITKDMATLTDEFEVENNLNIISNIKSIKSVYVCNKSSPLLSRPITTTLVAVPKPNETAIQQGFLLEMNKEKSKLQQILDSLCFVVGYDTYNEIITNVNKLNKKDEQKSKYFLTFNSSNMGTRLYKKFQIDELEGNHDASVFNNQETTLLLNETQEQGVVSDQQISPNFNLTCDELFQSNDRTSMATNIINQSSIPSAYDANNVLHHNNTINSAHQAVPILTNQNIQSDILEDIDDDELINLFDYLDKCTYNFDQRVSNNIDLQINSDMVESNDVTMDLIDDIINNMENHNNTSNTEENTTIDDVDNVCVATSDSLAVDNAIQVDTNNNNVHVLVDTTNTSLNRINSNQEKKESSGEIIKQLAKLILLRGGALFMKSYPTIRNVNNSANLRNSAISYLMNEKLVECGEFLTNEGKRTKTIYQAYLKLLPPDDDTNNSNEYRERMEFLTSLTKLDMTESEYKSSFKCIDYLSGNIATSIKCTDRMILNGLGQQRLNQYNDLVFYDTSRWHKRVQDETQYDQISDTEIADLTKESNQRPSKRASTTKKSNKAKKMKTSKSSDKENRLSSQEF